MLLMWAPFLYQELTSAPVAKKRPRALPTDDPSAQLAPVVPQPEPAKVEGPAVAPKAPQPPAAEEPSAPEPQKPAAAEPKDDPAPAGARSAQGAVNEPNSQAEPQADEAERADDPAPAPPPAAAGPAGVLRHAFETEPRDPLWATDTEARLKAMAGGGDLPAELLQSAACRNAVCRIELRWTAERATAYDSFSDALHQQFGGELGVEPVGAPDDKGQEQVNLYVTRKGYTVADLSR